MTRWFKKAYIYSLVAEQTDTCSLAPAFNEQTVMAKLSYVPTPSSSNRSFPLVIVLTLLVLVSLTGCQSIRSIFHPEKTKPVEDFDAFYDRFHADESFQRSRVRFPLGGMMVEEGDEIPWTRKNFPTMKVRIYDVDTSEYKIEYQKEKTRFTQRVWLEDSEFSSEYRFELIDGKWYLVYVLDVS